MPLEKRKAKTSPEIAISARAELRAEVKTEIPAASSGRLLDALTDIIRPFSETRGLKADLIRLQREEVLIEIAQRASRRLALEGSEVKPIPNKFFVPFLEKASLEELDSQLLETWTSLLTAAATNFDPQMVRFTSILSEIGPAEVKFLSRLCSESRNKKPLTFVEDVPHLFYQVELVQNISRRLNPKKSLRINAEAIIREHELPGGIITLICVHEYGGEGYDINHPISGNDFGKQIGLLQSLGIVDYLAFLSGNKGKLCWYGEAVALTSFGVSFVAACEPDVREAMKRLR